MRNSISFFVLISILFISCNTDNKINPTNEKKSNDLDLNHMLGKVKEYKSESYIVEKYDNGKPIFIKSEESFILFNEYGFIIKSEISYTSDYLDTYRNENRMYSNPENGILSKRIYEYTTNNKISDDSNSEIKVEQTYLYNSKNEKLLKREDKDLINNNLKTTNFKYNSDEIRISQYDSDFELINLEIQKLNGENELISSKEYDENGKENDVRYLTYLNNGYLKDSTVLRFDNEDNPYGVTVSTYDNNSRILEHNYYDDGLLEKITGFKRKYSSDNYNSSYIQEDFKTLNKVVVERSKVERELDNEGNLKKEIITDLDSEKIIKKTTYNFTYYE